MQVSPHFSRVTREKLASIAESDLLAMVRAGDPDALAELYARHAGTLLRTAYHVSGSAADAEDAVHDLFVGLPELLRRYDERGRLGAWLRAVVIRVVLANTRRESRRERLAHGEGLARGPASQEHQWEAVDLARAIASLPLELRRVFALRQLEGYSHNEIAELLEITPGASRVRYLRAIRRLRAVLEPEY